MSNDEHGPSFWPSMNYTIGKPYNGTLTDARYALSGKIMMAAIFVLLGVVVFMLALHIYARCYLFRSRRRRRRTHLVFYVDPSNNAPPPSTGLDPAALKSLPTFTFAAAENEGPAPECAVCLSEFEDGERGRRLPKCDHTFHVDCIDMWFHSHSTCPLCRTPVDSVELAESTQREPNSELEADLPPGPGPGPGPGPSTSSSFGGRRKAMDFVGVSVEVPTRSASFSFGQNNSDELGPSSKSPTRLMALRRMLSREKRPPSSPANGTSGGGDSEVAEMEEGRVVTRPQTPR